MKEIQKILLASTIVLMGITRCIAMPPITIHGPTSVGKGATVTYTYDAGALITGGMFWATNATAYSFGLSGTQYSVNITWSSTATSGVVYFGTQEPTQSTMATLTVTLITCTGILTPTSIVNGAICANTGGSVTLSASAPATNYQVRWYTPGYNSFLAVGAVSGTSTYTTPTLSAATTYNVTAFLTTNNCESVPVTATVSAIVTPLPVGYAVSNLGTNTDSLHANGADYGTGFTNKWYSASTGGTALATTTKWLTPTLTSATPYYVSTYYNSTSPSLSCESPTRATVTAKVSPPIIPTTLTRFVVRADNVTNDTQLYTLNSTQADSTIIYYDGLSRVVQRVDRRASPLKHDIITPVEYDANGRTSKDYLPYVVSHSRQTSAEVFDALYSTNQGTFYSTSGDKIADDVMPYAKANYEPSPLGRVTEQGAVGQAWQTGSGHSQQISYSYNAGATANQEEEVRQFNSDASSSGFYAANTLSRTQVTDANGNLTIVFKDGAGHTLAKKQQLDTTIAGTKITFMETYYIYNDMGQLAYILPPKATTLLKAASWSVTQTFLDTWCFQFTYDYRDRLTRKKSPGQAAMYIAYDPLNRPVLVQTGFLRTNNQWQFVKYDSRNRPVMAGLYTDNTNTTLAQIQALLNGLYTASNSAYPAGSFFESRDTVVQGYNNISFPIINGTSVQVQNVSYYDTYDFDNNGTKDFVYDSTQIAGTTSMWRASGLATGGKSLILGTSTWLSSYVFYDKYGRTIQTRSNNQLSSAIDNLTTVAYDPNTRLATQTKTYHDAGGTNQYTIVQTPTYDSKGRIIQLSHSINGAANQIVAQYQYNELGQVVAKQLHNTGGTSFIQTVDLRYNIRGWLTSINNAQLANDGGVTNSDTNDFFGMELLYNTTDPTSLTTTPYYNGNISAVKWKGAGGGNTTTGERSYTFKYDKNDQMLSGTFQKYGTSSWNQEQNTLNESATYDQNGNLTTLIRRQNNRTLSGTTVINTHQTIDSLFYNYSKGNRLSSVSDASGNTAGFNDGANTSNEYVYDTLGNLTADANKGISAIVYNTLGKAQQVTFSNGNVVTYTYDAGGNKLSMASTVSGTTTTTNYVNGFVYNTVGSTNTLNFFSSPEGRVVKNTSGSFEYQYVIADHLGNTRVVFTSATPTPAATLADFDGDANDQESQYSDVPTPITYSAANHTPSGSKVVRMNQTTPVGPSLSKQVYPGDKVDMEVYSYYESSSGYGTSNAAVAGMITSIASALIANTGGVDMSGVKSSGVNSALTNFGTGANQGDTQPAAFLNYILFDQNYKVMNAGWQVVPSGSFSKQYVNIPTVTVTEPGYIFVYLSYEDQSNNWVYFDDMKVTVTPTQVIQNNEYYPFGLQTAESWTRSGTTNNFLYNQGSEVNTTTGYYDLPYRNYDPALGRFFQVDPMATSSHTMTPYHYAGNNPVGSNDPTGLLPPPPPDNWSATLVNGGPAAAANTPFSAGTDDVGTGGSDLDNMINEGIGNGSIDGGAYTQYLSKYSAYATYNTDGTISVTAGDALATVGTDGSLTLSSASGTISGGTILFNSGGTTYAGNFTTTNGTVTSLSYAPAAQDESGGYVQAGSQTFVDYEANPSSASSTGGQWPDLGTFFTAASGIAGATETGIATGTMQSLKTISYSGIKAGLKATAAMSAVGVGLSVAGASYNVLTTGKLKGSDIASIGTTVVLVGAGIALGTVAAPALAAAGLIVGIASFVGQDWLDDTIGTYTIFDKPILGGK